MPDVDPILVQRIADEVAKALAAKDGPAHVHPPAGVCTGDYGQFKDRPDLVGSPTNPSNTPTPEPADTSPPPPVLTGIITADQLRAAIAESPDGKAHLATDARLTPLAADHARENPDQVIRESEAGHAGPEGLRPWVWWTASLVPTVQQAMATAGRRVRPLAATRSTTALPGVIKDVAAAVRSGQALGGLLFVEQPGVAAALANRCDALRAMPIVMPAYLDAARQLGANLYLFPTTAPTNLIQKACDHALANPPRPDAMLSRSLAELHRT